MHDLVQALRPFAIDALPSNAIISLMTPETFLRLASPSSSRIQIQHRERLLKRLYEQHVRFASLPEFILTLNGTDAQVLMHDGRHRVIVLRDHDAALIPVVIHIESDSGQCLDTHQSAACLDTLVNIFPQVHEDDEAYPDLSDEELEERLGPLPARDIFNHLFSTAAN